MTYGSSIDKVWEVILNLVRSPGGETMDVQARLSSQLNSTLKPEELDEVEDGEPDDDDEDAALSAYPRPSSLDPFED